MTRPRSGFVARVGLAFCGALALSASLVPGALATDAAEQLNQRYIVVFDGRYALDGSYALGDGYALVGEYALDDEYALRGTYALDAGYALGRNYALYALDDVYALANEYALQDTYALFEEYALNSDYALDNGYALGSGYALARATAGYALDSTYALTSGYALYALDSTYALANTFGLGDNYALARDYALNLVVSAGGTVTADLTRQLGVMIVDSKNETFAETMRSYALVQDVGADLGWKQFPSFQEAVASGQLTLVAPNAVAPSALGSDPLEAQQWGMKLIRAPQARALQTGAGVEVGIVDTGIDGNHLDFVSGTKSNVDCVRGADFTFEGPGIGTPAACVDNNFHGTHVAGIVAARLNGTGVVGVAPNATLVPIKVCDADGHCYASDAIEGITYAGDVGLDVINMSFFVDDDEFQQSTEFKCADDPTQHALRKAVERAIAYARNQGVTPIAALGNSDEDLAHPASGNGCDVTPAETAGVTGTASVGPESGKAAYSNWGSGATDVTAPGGDFVEERDAASGQTICDREILSTIPGNLWGCFQGTSMASPHSTGVAALIVGQFGKRTVSGAVSLSPESVASRLQSTAIDIGLKGYDECFGNGRIDALRAVKGDTSRLYDTKAPYCPEYNE